ncbi:hypothetical protein GCM10008020_21880 [Massilia psychrophila]|nr:hypothetical protein GCM10008020_21880 [Massilia psychrophila]
MGVHKRRRHQVAAGIDLARRAHRQRGPDGGNPPAFDRDIDLAPAVRQAGIANDKIHDALR